MLLGEIAQHMQKLLQKRGHRFNLIPQIHPDIQSHLIVAASCGMQPLPCIAKPRSQFRLHKHMDIFGRRINSKPSIFQIIKDFAKPHTDGVCLTFFNNTLLSKHGCMGNTAHNVMLVHPAVERNGRVEIVYLFIFLF